MLKTLFFIILLTISSYATSLTINDSIRNFTIKDQFDKTHHVTNKVQTILVSFEKDTGAEINTYLNSKNPTFLEEHQAIFIANISQMPSIITSMFALPKMRKYKHPIYLIYDEENQYFKYQENKITVYSLQNGNVIKIDYIETKEELASIFQ